MSTVAAPTVDRPAHDRRATWPPPPLLAGANRQLPAAARDVLAVGAATVTTVLAAVALAISAHGRIVYWFGGWHPVHGTVIGVDYVVDPMGGALAVLAGVLAVAALVYSRRFFGTTGGRYPALVLVFVAASVDFAWTGDLFNMFVAFELVAVVGFVLTGYYAESEAPLQGAINFAVTNTFGGLVFLVGLSLLYGHTGTLNLAQMGQSLAGAPCRRPGCSGLRPPGFGVPHQGGGGAMALLAARRLRHRAGPGLRALRRGSERTRSLRAGPNLGDRLLRAA